MLKSSCSVYCATLKRWIAFEFKSMFPRSFLSHLSLMVVCKANKPGVIGGIPSKRPVIRKSFPCHEINMIYLVSYLADPHPIIWNITCNLKGFPVFKSKKSCIHDDVIKWKHFPCYWPFVRVIHRSSVDSPHKVLWRGALMFYLMYAWTNGLVNNRDAREQTMEAPVIGDAMMSMWRHRNGIYNKNMTNRWRHTFKQHRSNLYLQLLVFNALCTIW